MAEHFTYLFDQEHVSMHSDLVVEQLSDKPSLETVGQMAAELIREIPEVQELPEHNQQMLEMMSQVAIFYANRSVDPRLGLSRANNFWGLYIVGSRARHQVRPSSDLDLLSVGTFFRRQGFIYRERPKDGELGSNGNLDVNVYQGFTTEIPTKLPTSYNVGAVERKFLIRAEPDDATDALPVDVSVVDLTFPANYEVSLSSFKAYHDVKKRSDDGLEKGEPLPRIPVFEIRSEQFYA